MYYSDNFDDYNEEINTDNRDDDNDYYYEEFSKKCLIIGNGFPIYLKCIIQ